MGRAQPAGALGPASGTHGLRPEGRAQAWVSSPTNGANGRVHLAELVGTARGSAVTARPTSPLRELAAGTLPPLPTSTRREPAGYVGHPGGVLRGEQECAGRGHCHLHLPSREAPRECGPVNKALLN